MGGLAQYWDLCTAAALVYTAIVTPYEVAFLAPPSPSEKWSDSIFIINRCVDVIFIDLGWSHWGGCDVYTASMNTYCVTDGHLL